MPFVFQGDPQRFDIDDYLARYPFIYWSIPVLQGDVQVNDQVIIWRSGETAGAVALGRISELPTEIKNLQHPEALGDDLWRTEIDDPSVIKVGITINEVRLSIEEGMVTREALKNDPVLRKNRIITNPQGTVFQLLDDELNQFFAHWDNPLLLEPSTGEQSAIEGATKLRLHYSRERSQFLVKQKRKAYISKHGHLKCELCGLAEGEKYPKNFGVPFIEVHHRIPLSSAPSEVRTNLEDLVLLCANCHRVIHSSKDVEHNFDLLCKYYNVQT